MRVQIPGDYQALKKREPALASEWREASAEAFEACLSEGLEAVAFDKWSATYVFANKAATSSGVRAAG